MNTDTHTSGSTVKQHIKKGVRIQCNTENFVPIVVPGLSTSSSSSLPSSTSMTPSRQEIDHPTSTSPTMTSSTVSSESVARQERRDPCSSEISEEQLLTKPTKKPKAQKKVDHDQEREDPCHSTHWNGCKSSETILWMTKFLNTESHTPVLLMNHLLEPTRARSAHFG